MTLDYEMVKEFETGWAEFQRQESRREKLRAFIKAVGRWLVGAFWLALGIGTLLAVGAMVAAAAFMDPAEVGL